jgi:hypothetical protein
MTSEKKPDLAALLKNFAEQVGGPKAAAALDIITSPHGREVVIKVFQDAATTLGGAVEQIVHDAQVTALEATLKRLREKDNKPSDPA